MSNPATIQEQLVSLLNEALLAQQGLEAEYSVEDVTFGEPTLYAPGVIDLTQPTSRNTVVGLTVEVAGEDAEADPIEITYNMHYNRLSIAHLLERSEGEIELTGDETSVYDILDQINARIGVELSEDDIEETLIEEDEGVYSVVLRAADASLGYFGEIVLALTAPVQDDPPADDPPADDPEEP